MTEPTAHHTLALRRALGKRSGIAWTGVLSRQNGDTTETHRGTAQRECALDDKCHLVGDPVRLIVATRKS